MPQSEFRVIIVGGSVTGLTLAHCLHRIGVDYLVLEKRKQIALQEGASVGILPNGARILDQLGLYDAVEQDATPLGTSQICFPDGFQFVSSYPKKVQSTFGYPIAFMQRQQLLEILHKALPDKSKIRVNSQVSRIEQLGKGEGEGGMRVHTLDGEVFEGDLVVGADGVHSKARAEMWRMASLLGAGEIPANEKNSMKVEYSCIFGISTGIPELQAGEQVLRVNDGWTLMVIPAKCNLVYWFFIKKLDRIYQYGSAPRFTPEEATAQCLQLADVPVLNGARFQDLWERRQTFNMVRLEENVFQTWSCGRLVCIGDSIHKMTINLGQGANCAIEGVAVLANLLRDSLNENKRKLSDLDVDTLLRRFNKVHLPRVSHIFNLSWSVTRVHARDGFLFRLVGRYGMPYFGERFESRPLRMLADGAMLDFLPLTRRPYLGWERYRSKESGARPLGVTVASSLILALLIVAWGYNAGVGRGD